MKIESLKADSESVTVEVRRKDGSTYTLMLLPKNDEVLLNFSGISDSVLKTNKTYANQVVVEINRG